MQTYTQAAQAIWSFFSESRTAAKSGSLLSDQAALYRIALLASLHEDGARKGAPKIACSSLLGQQTAGGEFSNPCGQTKKLLNLILEFWNVRTLIDSISSERPERRTALIARELGRYQVDINALSETRLSDKGQLTEIGGGYTFFWSGRKSGERREAGVGFAIKNQLVKKLDDLPESLNDRLMKLKLPLGKKKNCYTHKCIRPHYD